MSPHGVRGTVTCTSVEGGRERRWEGNSLSNELPLQNLQEKKCTTSMWNSNTCAYVSTPLTIRGTQALFIADSVKLHVTA